MRTALPIRSVQVFGLVCFAVLVFLLSLGSYAQCPLDIDFENGNFDGWRCYTGFIQQDGTIRVAQSAPALDRHVIYKSGGTVERDYWGGFPKVCPNGSNYSMRLGNDNTGRGAEKISYTFTIPPGQNNFSLVYNYAIVLQDPGHSAFQQPRMRVEVMNLTDNKIDPCSSFDFVVNGSLPGFKVSPIKQDSSIVRYKEWSAAFIDLSGNAGKTFSISFLTTDCSLGAHFGYAYIDINSICSNTVPGSVYCPDDKFLELTAPPGFQSYKWFNSAQTVLGTGATLRLEPPPATRDTIYVAFDPFSGYGCSDTLIAYLADTLQLTANAGVDNEFCVNPAIQLGINPKPGEVYKWSPSTGLSDPDIANPIASPRSSTLYTLTVQHTGGGCKTTDQVSLVKKCDVIEFYVPNSFTPNGDGLNDRLKPVLYGYSKVNYFRIYNRYGDLLYEANSDLPGWDGTLKGKRLPTQTVVWMIEAIDANGIVERRQGSSVLIR